MGATTFIDHAKGVTRMLHNIHEHYEQLTDAEREFVDRLMDEAFALAKEDGVHLTGDDRAERAVDVMVKWVIQSRPEINVGEHVPEVLPELQLDSWKRKAEEAQIARDEEMFAIEEAMLRDDYQREIEQ